MSFDSHLFQLPALSLASLESDCEYCIGCRHQRVLRLGLVHRASRQFVAERLASWWRIGVRDKGRGRKYEAQQSQTMIFSYRVERDLAPCADDTIAELEFVNSLVGLSCGKQLIRQDLREESTSQICGGD